MINEVDKMLERAKEVIINTESRHLDRDFLHVVLGTETEIIGQLEKLIIRGVEKGCFKTGDAYMAACIIQYLVMIYSLRGWSFKD